ncbi:MAG TPA: hypothetical protein VKK79_05470 [Candidatus Lokiarchaeia archaeon]|nr:hypothetical protein [Candidatus Lokiarchaeia archaeon]
MNDIENLSSSDREYYRAVWGFDPVTDRTTTEDGMFRYEASFPLDQDPPLQAVGVTIIARVDWNSGGTRNRIIFRQEKRETAINCVHTVIYEAPADEVLNAAPEDLLQHVQSTENRPATLPPWEHFAALKSYVGGIADIGIRALMKLEWLPSEFGLDLKIGHLFAVSLPEQIVIHLSEFVPNAFQALLRDALLELFDEINTEELSTFFQNLRKSQKLRAILLPDPPALLALLEFAPGDWLREHLSDLVDTTGFATQLFTSLSTFEEIRQKVPDAPWELVAARYPQTSPKLLAILADSDGVEVRRAVAGNANTMGYVLEKLATDPDLHVKIAVVKNRNCPVHLFESLVRAGSEDIHRAIVGSLRLQPEIVRKLAYSPDVVVRRRIAEFHSLAFPTFIKLTRDPDVKVRCLLAARANLPQTICVKMSKDPAEEVRRIIANNPNTPYGTLAQLAMDSDTIVRRNITQNSNISPAILQQLLQDSDETTRNLAESRFRKKE